MKKLFKNNIGFTLVELLIAGGLVGGVALIGMSTLKTSNQAANIEIIGSELSTLKSTIAAQLSNPEACAVTFPSGTPAVSTNVIIKNQSGGIIAKKDLEYGARREFKVTEISTSSAVGSKVLQIKVDYLLRPNLDKTRKQSNSFTIDLFVTKTGVNNIASCFVDIAGSTRAAVEYSCQGNGANYNAGSGTYGTCTHPLPTMMNGASVVTTTCPTGMYLKRSSTGTAPDKVKLECEAFSVAPCPAWSYLNKVNDTNGTADCIALSTFFSTGKVLSATATGYVPLTLHCVDPDTVLRRVNGDGSATCIPKLIDKTCPADEYVYDVVLSGTDSYTVQCKKFTRQSGACAAGQYLRAVNSDGSIPAGGCQDLSIPANCSGVGGGDDYVISAIDSNGNASCVRSF